jgi:hypothetical protein
MLGRGVYRVERAKGRILQTGPSWNHPQAVCIQ